MSKDFSEEEIIDLYNSKVKLPPSYFESLSFHTPCPVPAFERQWKIGDYGRVRTILDFQRWVGKYGLEEPDYLACTCQSDPELYFLRPKVLKCFPYPQFDLHEIGEYKKEVFTMFVFNHTLEHLYNPIQAIKGIWNILKPGGIVFTSVPTLSIPHSTPIHFAGFTPMGLAMLFASNGFEILEIGQWGCKAYIQEQWKRFEFIGGDVLKEHYKDELIPNEEAACVQCWILAKKPT